MYWPNDGPQVQLYDSCFYKTVSLLSIVPHPRTTFFISLPLFLTAFLRKQFIWSLNEMPKYRLYIIFYMVQPKSMLCFFVCMYFSIDLIFVFFILCCSFAFFRVGYLIVIYVCFNVSSSSFSTFSVAFYCTFYCWVVVPLF